MLMLSRSPDHVRFGLLDFVTKNGKVLVYMTFSGFPTYSVKYYREGLYKLVKFKTMRGIALHSREEEQAHEHKLDAALSRARSAVFQIAVCNDWDYFFTGTLDPKLNDRNDLFAFRNRFTQFIRDLRKRPGFEKLAYLLIPERHKDGAWHMHGLIRGLPESELSYFVPGLHPLDLVHGGYRNWDAFRESFGYCSLGRIRDNEAAAFYLTKYISKDMQSSVTEVGGHTYYTARGLKRAVPFGDIYGSDICLDRYLQQDNQFCSVGYVRDVSWDFWLDYIDLSNIEMITFDDGSIELNSAPEYEQLFISGFPGPHRGVE